MFLVRVLSLEIYGFFQFNIAILVVLFIMKVY